MRLFLFLLVVLMSDSVHSTEQKSYIVVKASVIGSHEQPTWLCLLRHGDCKHLPANKVLHAVKPGKREIHHVDFSERKHSGKGTQFFNDSMKFKLKPGKIYFIGELELEKKNRNKYSISIKKDASLLEQACMSSPEIFEDFMVTSLSAKVEHKFTCSNANR